MDSLRLKPAVGAPTKLAGMGLGFLDSFVTLLFLCTKCIQMAAAGWDRAASTPPPIMGTMSEPITALKEPWKPVSARLPLLTLHSLCFQTMETCREYQCCNYRLQVTASHRIVPLDMCSKPRVGSGVGTASIKQCFSVF